MNVRLIQPSTGSQLGDPLFTTWDPPTVSRTLRDAYHRRIPSAECYANYMAQGMFHRAGVAILLIATLVFPFGMCQPPAGAANHDCCSHHSAPVASLKANCCIVRGEVPAVAVEQAAVNPVALSSVSSILVTAGPAIAIKPGVPVALPDHSPPGSKSILRI